MNIDLGTTYARLTAACQPFKVSYRDGRALRHPPEALGELRRATEAATLALNHAPQALPPEQAEQRRELTLLAKLAKDLLRQHEAAPR